LFFCFLLRRDFQPRRLALFSWPGPRALSTLLQTRRHHQAPTDALVLQPPSHCAKKFFVCSGGCQSPQHSDHRLPTEHTRSLWPARSVVALQPATNNHIHTHTQNREDRFVGDL